MSKFNFFWFDDEKLRTLNINTESTYVLTMGLLINIFINYQSTRITAAVISFKTREKTSSEIKAFRDQVFDCSEKRASSKTNAAPRIETNASASGVKK